MFTTSPATGWDCVHFVESWDSTSSEEYRISILPGEQVTNGDSLVRLLANAFDFPDYFGCNLDAAEDCLRDLEWIGATGYVLVVTESARLWQNSPSAAGSLVSLWLSAAEEWSKSSTPFHLIFVK
ncbi:MAG TPA: barstar family protein [Longimicrobium sp.]|jgi:RNAse (barnase) inhibitor barstar